MHDNNGNPLTKLPLCVPEQPPGAVPIIGLDWYHGLEGYTDPNAPTLAVAFENGKLQVRVATVCGLQSTVQSGVLCRFGELWSAFP